MKTAALHLVNLLLPGSGLILRDRIALGVPLLLVSLLALAILLVGAPLAIGDLAGHLWRGALAAQLLAALAAGLLLWRWERTWPSADTGMQAAYRRCVRAYLAGEPTAARRAVDELLRRVPGHPGAWRLLAMVATDAGDGAAAARAARRLRRLAVRRALTAGDAARDA